MAPSTTIRRLLKEVAELSPDNTNPNPAFFAAPVSDSNLHEWHFTILGPPKPSPYAGGLYHGRISLPAQYPLKPPNFRFLTPSGRFEVNREICLSISGFHEETWMPAWGVRTALTALRSFMAEAGTAGQVGGLESSDEVRKQLANESKRWRCHDCSKTNTDIMEEWWKACREQGVTVDEEDLGLEALPDGMSVEAIDRSKGKAKESETHDSSALPQPTEKTDTEAAGSVVSLPSSQQQQQLPTSSLLSASSATSSTLTPSQPRPQPTKTNPSSSTSSSITAGTQSTSRPISSRTQSSQIQIQTQPQRQRQRQAQDTQGITLDRAITAIFLALCVMILRKIFLSSSRSGYGSGAGDEWEIGLSREY